MSTARSNAEELVKQLERKAPEYLDLMTAETDAEFEVAFDALLAKAIAHLEKNKKNFEKLDEPGLCGALAGVLSIPGLTVTQESNSNGHVDLTIDVNHCNPPRTKLGEAKIHKGPEYHMKGLEQLFGYTTGREGRVLIVNYVRKKNISKLVETIRTTMDSEKPLKQQGKTKDHPTLQWSFISTHRHSCGDDMDVGHVACNLFIDSV